MILHCDFSKGFEPPEMVKRRPVVIISSELKGRKGLVTIVPISTVEPNPIEKFHYQLPKASLPMLPFFQDKDNWIKGDMLYTVAFHRLDLIQLGTRNAQGKRNYFSQRLGREQMKAIYECVLYGINLPDLAKHL